MPQGVRAFEAHAKLVAGTPRDLDAGVTLLREGLEAVPGGSDRFVAAVATLDKAGRTADADALFRQALDAYRAILKDHPASAWAKYNAAWLASGCRREADLALAYARDAAAAEPGVRGHREALAEAHFRKGDRAAAVAGHGQARRRRPAQLALPPAVAALPDGRLRQPAARERRLTGGTTFEASRRREPAGSDA